MRDRSLEGATGRRQTAPVPHLLAPRPRAGEVFVGLDLGPLVVHQVTRATHRGLTRRLVLLVTFAGTETKIRFRYRSGTELKHATVDKPADVALEQGLPPIPPQQSLENGSEARKHTHWAAPCVPLRSRNSLWLLEAPRWLSRLGSCL